MIRGHRKQFTLTDRILFFDFYSETQTNFLLKDSRFQTILLNIIFNTLSVKEELVSKFLEKNIIGIREAFSHLTGSDRKTIRVII